MERANVRPVVESEGGSERVMSGLSSVGHARPRVSRSGGAREWLICTQSSACGRVCDVACERQTASAALT